jgi:hypothetical protein
MSLLTAARELRAAQRAYMTARALRGGATRVYDTDLNVLGRAVAESAGRVDQEIAKQEESNRQILALVLVILGLLAFFGIMAL